MMRPDRAKGLTKQVTLVEQVTGRIYYRRTRKRKQLFAQTSGSSL